MRDYAQLYLDAVSNDDLHHLLKDLIKENKKLQIENNYYRNIECQLLTVQTWKHQLIFNQDDSPMAFDEFKMKNNELYFMTITFDPDRFDNLQFTSEEQQKSYILFALYKHRHYINFVYGCFEKHQNGIIHSHLIINFNDYQEYKEKYFKELKSRFTRNLRNKYTIDIEAVRDLNKVIQYIDDGEKLKYGFYQYYNSTNYL